jgi:hypothetical protein
MSFNLDFKTALWMNRATLQGSSKEKPEDGNPHISVSLSRAVDNKYVLT